MQADQKGLFPAKGHVSVAKVHRALADAFHFRSGKHDARFNELQKLVIVAGLFILGDLTAGAFLVHTHRIVTTLKRLVHQRRSRPENTYPSAPSCETKKLTSSGKLL